MKMYCGTKKAKSLLRISAMIVAALTACESFAYLPTYKYIQSERIRYADMGLSSIKTSFMSDSDVLIDNLMYDAREVYEMGGPIRYYYKVIMPRLPEERLDHELREETKLWMSKCLIEKNSAMIIKPKTAHETSVKKIQQEYHELLMKMRTEIGMIYNEYLVEGINPKSIDLVAKQYNDIAKSRMWKQLKERQPNLQNAAKKYFSENLNQGYDFDVSISKLYGPIIDAKVDRYRCATINGDHVQNVELDRKLKNADLEVRRARREAREARIAAEEAFAEAQEAKRNSVFFEMDSANNNPAMGAVMLQLMRHRQKEAKKQAYRDAKR